jgi:SAM-dependent methyltransferase
MKHLLGLAARLRLDRVFYRLWRYSPRGVYRLYQHHRFDRTRNVETRGYGDLRYEPTPASTFSDIFDSLELDFAELTFIDIGSGKGKALLLAAAYPFRRILGVERFEDLHRIALRNVAGHSRIELVCEDAARYAFPPEPSIVYFFNPFSEEILRDVVANLECSLKEYPRPVYVVYYAPILKRGSPWDRRRLFDQSPLLRPLRDARTCTVYESFDG